jgi:type II secretory pathway component GspD/PulD (secretin)
METLTPVMIVRYRLQLFLALFIVLFAWGVFPEQASAEMRLFELQHRPVGELAEMVRSLLGEEARVATDRNTLVVNASPSALDEVARLVDSYDRSKQMLRVTIEQGKTLSGHERGVSTSGRLQNDDSRIVIGPSGKKSPEGGSTIIVDSGQNRLKLRGTDSRYRESRQVSQFVSVLEGEPALVSVGRAVPFTSQMLTYWRQHPGFIATTSYENVDTGFEVLPTLYNGMVEIEVRPFMASLDRDNPQQIVFHELATKVNVPVGAWYELGGHMQAQDDLSREILGAGRGSMQNGSSVRVKVETE